MALFKKKSTSPSYKSHSIDKIIVRFLESRDKGKFGAKDKIFFFKELAYLTVGGIGLNESVEIIFQNTDNFAVKEIAKNISHYLHSGKPLSYALSRMPDYFDEGDIHIIKAGEQTGNLSLILKSLATEYSYINTIKNKYIGALLYPMILIVIAVAAGLGLFLRVLPEVFGIVESFPDITMPWSTQMLKTISDFLREQRKPFTIISALFIFFLSIFFSTDTGKKASFNLLSEIPLIGKMTKYFYLIKRCRYMKIMLNAGMSYVETFQLLRDILGVSAYQDMLERVLSGLQKGESIYDSLKYEQHLIPTNVATLIRVGEESANLTVSVDNILHIYEEELNNMIDRLAKVIEPIMLVLIGGMVVTIALGVFGLIFQVMEGAGL